MLLNREVLSALAGVVSGDPTRGAIRNVHVRPDGRLEATDGHVLVIAKALTPSAAEYPSLPGLPDAAPEGTEALIPPKAIREAAKIAKGAKHLSVLAENLSLRLNGRPVLAVTNLDTTASFACVEDETFPNVDQIVAGVVTEDNAAHVVGLGIEALETLLTAMKAINRTSYGPANCLRFVFPKDPSAAIRVESLASADVLAVLMPIRLPEKD